MAENDLIIGLVKNTSGSVTMDDATIVLQAATDIVAGNTPILKDWQLKRADVDSDGDVTADDANSIAQYCTDREVAKKIVYWDDMFVMPLPKIYSGYLYNNVFYYDIGHTYQIPNDESYKYYNNTNGYEGWFSLIEDTFQSSTVPSDI